jgi:CheY-like chemotaxis protein
MSEKPTIFIAEDSTLLKQFEADFRGKFAVVSAQTGIEAFALIDKFEHFDICLLDVVMPVESSEMPGEKAMSTGLRLIEHLLLKKKTERLVVVTVRSNVSEEILQMTRDKAKCIVLHKRDVEPKDIRQAVDKLMAE